MSDYQPKTGMKCSCRPGIERDNCSSCEGTGERIDFAAIRSSYVYGDPVAAFEKALASGRLTLDKPSPNWVGYFMYMGTKDGRDLFKNRNTREYLP